MSIAANLLAEFEHESKTTRRFLEQLPEDKLNWKPHEKSMTAGQLAMHIAMVPTGIMQMAKADENPAPDFNRPNPQPKSVKEILDTLDAGVAEVKKSLPTYSDASMAAMWKMVKDGKPLIAMPRVMFFRNILLNHLYHHRGQFGVYLRMVGAKVPSSYGPSGDEMPNFG